MVKCPRCENMVDETERTTCPVCFTPLQTQASAPPPQTVPPPVSPTVPLPPQSAPYSPGNETAPLPANYVQNLPPGAGTPYTPPGPQTAPLPPNYLQNNPPPGAGTPYTPPNVRVSLTGEVIPEDTGPNPNEPLRPGSYGGAGQQNSSPIPPLRAGAAPRINSPSRRETSSSGSGGGTGVIAVIAIVVLLGLAGFGGWWFLSHRSNPKDQATKFFTAVKALDFKGIYETTEPDPAKYSSEKDFEDKEQAALNQNPAMAGFVKGLLSSIEFKVGEPTIDGDTANVPITVSARGQSQQQTLKMKRVDGIWKVAKDGNTFGAGMSGALGGGGFGGN